MFPGPLSSQGPGNDARQMIYVIDYYPLKEKIKQ
jgi:hypothetical protein